jgi:hypothetical protein
MRDVQGRIDHLAIDVLGRRIFVAALGNNSLQVIGLKENKRVHSVTGLAEPQRVAYVPSANRVFVATSEDGSVRAFDAVSWKLLKSISYGEDADNLRIDLANGHIWVLYGSGALGEFDPEGTKVAEIELDAHPESFRLEKNGPRVFVNLPKCRKDRCRGSSSAIRSDVLANRRPSLELSHGAGRAKSPAICGHTTTAEAYRIRHLRRQADRKRSRQRRFVMTSSMTSAAGEFRPSAAKAASLFLRRGLETATANLAESRP